VESVQAARLSTEGKHNKPDELATLMLDWEADIGKDHDDTKEIV
jgi:hypothetical protein